MSFLSRSLKSAAAARGFLFAVAGCSGTPSSDCQANSLGGGTANPCSGTGGLATGGVASTGGTPATGGTIGTAGSPATGGTTTTGGTPSTGGTLATGGTLSTGGALATGGTPATGGAVATGGTRSTGGNSATGGSGETGGSSSQCVPPWFGTASASPVTLAINEIESNAPNNGNDWIELSNFGAASVDLTCVRILDAQSNYYLFPTGTILGAGAVLVIEQNLQFNFDLGAPDNVSLYDASGRLIDSYSWTVHAPNTYARCPNGTGSFVNWTYPTKGTVNTCDSA